MLTWPALSMQQVSCLLESPSKAAFLKDVYPVDVLGSLDATGRYGCDTLVYWNPAGLLPQHPLSLTLRLSVVNAVLNTAHPWYLLLVLFFAIPWSCEPPYQDNFSTMNRTASAYQRAYRRRSPQGLVPCPSSMASDLRRWFTYSSRVITNSSLTSESDWKSHTETI